MELGVRQLGVENLKICSLLPSATEIVFALGLGERLAAVTHECDFPPEATRLPKITSSVFDHEASSSRQIHRHISESVHSGSSIYHLDREMLREIDPDLILTQELCDVCAVSYSEVRRAARLLRGERQVVSLEPVDLSGILATVEEVARLADVEEEGLRLTARLRERIDRVASRARKAASRPRVFAMEWLDPFFAGGHWVPEMVRLAGGVDGLAEEGVPSREVSWERIREFDPEAIVAMPCGFDLARTEREMRAMTLPKEWGSLQAAVAGQVYAVDGSAYFNRPGPRIVDGLEILAEILHPDLFPRKKLAHCWKRIGF